MHCRTGNLRAIRPSRPRLRPEAESRDGLTEFGGPNGDFASTHPQPGRGLYQPVLGTLPAPPQICVHIKSMAYRVIPGTLPAYFK